MKMNESIMNLYENGQLIECNVINILHLIRNEAVGAQEKAEKLESIVSLLQDCVCVCECYVSQQLGSLLICAVCGNVYTRIAWLYLTSDLEKATHKRAAKCALLRLATRGASFFERRADSSCSGLAAPMKENVQTLVVCKKRPCCTLSETLFYASCCCQPYENLSP